MRSLALCFMIVLSFMAATQGAAQSNAPQAATGLIYYDVATGHKYIKNADQSYREYSRRGILLRESVPNSLPLLTSNKYIREVGEDNYFLYQKNGYLSDEITVLPIGKHPPAGWTCLKLLVSSN